jgi:RNA polymerase sigma factor (sigma-70 family)
MAVINFHAEDNEIRNTVLIDSFTIRSIFPRYFEQLVYYAKRFVKDEDIARDAVHNAFIGLWGNREKLAFGSEPQLKAYLYLATRGKAVDLRRQAKKEQAKLNKFIQWDMVPDHPDQYDDAAVLATAIATIRDVINLLKPQCRAVMELLLEGKTHEEIALLLNMRQDAVRQNKARGIAFLQKKVNKHVLFILASIMLGQVKA